MNKFLGYPVFGWNSVVNIERLASELSNVFPNSKDIFLEEFKMIIDTSDDVGLIHKFFDLELTDKSKVNLKFEFLEHPSNCLWWAFDLSLNDFDLKIRAQLESLFGNQSDFFCALNAKDLLIGNPESFEYFKELNQ